MYGQQTSLMSSNSTAAPPTIVGASTISSYGDTTTKIYSPQITTMKLRLNQNRNNLSRTNNDENNENNTVLKLCSPPPLDGKDVEHIRRFELEI